MLLGDLLLYLHYQLVMVDRYIACIVYARKLVLCGCSLVVPGLCVDAEPHWLLVDLLHEPCDAGLDMSM